jgi:glycylpeptide N-tetradecanoyltransferase
VNLEGIFQAVYTSGTFLPTPVSTCQYFHRSINPKKLIEIQFSYLRPNMTMARTIKLYRLPTETRLAGWREANAADMPAVNQLLNNFMKRFDFTQTFSLEEVQHYFIPIPGVINSFVVEVYSTTDMAVYMFTTTH